MCFHRRSQVAVTPSKCRRLYSQILYGSLHHEQCRCPALAAITPSTTAPVARFHRATVAVVSLSFAPPTGHRVLPLLFANVALSRLPTTTPPSTFSALTASSTGDERVGLRLFGRRRELLESECASPKAFFWIYAVFFSRSRTSSLNVPC